MDQSTPSQLFRRRRALLLMFGAMLIIVSCGGVLWLLSSPADSTYRIQITSIEIGDSGHVTLRYESTRRSGTTIRIVLDGMNAGGSSAYGLWWEAVESSGNLLFHVNESHQEGTVETWSKRLLVETGHVYELHEGQPLELYRFQEEGNERYGYIVVE